MRNVSVVSMVCAAIPALLLAVGVEAQATEPAASRIDLSRDMVPVPDAAPVGDLHRRARHGEPAVIYLNLDGVDLVKGSDDARSDTSQLCGGSFPPYGNGQKRDATLQATAKDWERYNVTLTTERPADGEYTMAVVSPVSSSVCPYNGSGIYGIAPVDCGDQNGNSVVFGFLSENDGESATVHATVISQEVAHSYGLEHVMNNAGIMNPFPGGGDPAFGSECKDMSGTVFCGDQHAQFCPSNLIQNSHAELVAIVGERDPDMTAPVVTIVAPGDGDTFSPGADVLVTAEASDDGGVRDVRLLANGSAAGSADPTAPFEWNLMGLAAGSHALVAIASDAAGNEAQSAAVTITVTPGGGDDGGDTDGSGEDSDDFDPNDPDGEGPPTVDPSGEGNAGGCGCTSTRSRAAIWLFMLPMIGVVRRRRHHRGEGNHRP